ncbi:EAL domain-containing protein [Parvibaculum sp.]|uniref:EAL domain-containing protein n=1 Tax=Parvibaculum sp. TaxID=2024848 RepID=UPI00271E9569|nr:EAL domain-containing protein [Parvibaculum sp.]MDO9126489.1 EAL domain-containing protein [Parvibaculum sp.]MDP1626351.1 EAL domain-containing protein [Parvibaculum sp.]MDP2151258.1 EAL domain-containing protein [Parvibaculum sp.]MDP3327099.1 EAL domain-containing protein [Parvibaculum sp.]
MPLPIKHLAATLLYALPSVALAYGAIVFFAVDPKLAALGGLIACLLGAEAHAAISRGIERKAVRKELQELTSLAAGLSRDLDDAADKIVELEERFERETAERMERIFSEIRVVESLVKRLAETREFSGAVVAAAQPATIEASRPALELASPAPDSDVPPPKPEKRLEDMNDSELLETIRRSLETNRVDLYLQPVVSLPQRKVLYYEGLSRLRTDKGELIMPRDYMRVAEPAGMMPTVDNILLFRCIQVVRKLAQRNSKAGVFCNISAFSLLDEDFFPQFIDYMQHNTDLAQHLIFEFSQMTVNGAGPVERASLEALAALGFRFSMDQVTNLRFDVAALHDRNFRYVKVSAATMLEGRHTAGDIHAADLKELLRRNGIQLIVDKVETEREVVDVLDLDVELGQGFLFGEPRPVRESVLKDEPTRTEISIAAD